MKKSMIDLAFDELNAKHEAMTFLSLWEIVSKAMGFTPSQADDNIAQFYSDLSMDGRFVALPGNTWDLRKRLSSAHAIVDTDSLSIEDDEDEDEEEEIIDEEDTEETVDDEDE